MKQTLLSLVLLPLAAACSSTDNNMNSHSARSVRSSTSVDDGATEAVFPYSVQRAKLKNGLQVLMVPMPSDGLVSYWSVVRTGSRDEVEEGVTGFAHFFEHMMFRGTDKLPGKEYDRVVSGMGADANAFTSDDMTAYHLSFATASLPRVIEIEADRFQNLKYSEAEFKTESGAVFGEYRKGRSNPFEVLDESVRNVAFDKHTYKHTTIGFVADIEAMPKQYAYSKTFFKRFYRPENVVILVTGDFDPIETIEVIKKNYGAWQPGYQAPNITPEPEQTAKRSVDVPFKGKTQPIVALCFKGPAFSPTDRDAMAAKLAGELAFGSTSPLYKKLVLEDQKVAGVSGSLDPNRDPGLWWIYAIVKEATDVRAVENELWAAIADLKKTPVSAERLAAVRSNLRYSFLANLATPSDTAESVARYIALTGDVTCIDTMFQTLAKVTPEDVMRAADTWLREERCTVATLHTEGESISAAPTNQEKATALSTPSSPVLPPQHARYSITDASAPNLAALEGNMVSQPPVLMPIAQDPTVSFRVWFQVGSQDDPVGKEGLAALTGALLSEGATKKNAYSEILNKLFPLAASYADTVDKEMTLFSGQVHRDNTAAFYQLFVQAITEPAFEASDFERLRDQFVSEIENTLRFASEEELGKAALIDTIFNRTRYAHVGVGTVESLKSITLDDVRAFYAKYFTRDNVVIGMGGAYPRELPVRMKTDLGVLPGGKPDHLAKPTPAVSAGRRVVLVENKTAQGSSISMGVPIALQRGSREYYALWIANSWLGEHRNSSSHLYQVIREERGINYGNYSYIEAFPRGGGRRMPPQGVGRRQQMFEVWLRTLPTENALFSIRAALREIETLVAEGLTKEEFGFTKSFLKGYSSHYAESTFERLGYAIDDRFYGIDGHLTRFKKMMNEISLDEVNAAIKKYIRPEDLTIAIVTNDAAGLKAAFESGAPTLCIYPAGADKSAEILAEDAKISTWPLRVSPKNITIRPVEALFQSAGSALSPN